LDGWLVSRKEGMVLFEQGQGLSTGRWRMRLSFIHPYSCAVGGR